MAAMHRARSTLFALACGAICIATAGAAKTGGPIAVTNGKSFRGVETVVIGSFAIGFLTSKTDQATSGKRGIGGSSAIVRSP